MNMCFLAGCCLPACSSSCLLQASTVLARTIGCSACLWFSSSSCITARTTKLTTATTAATKHGDGTLGGFIFMESSDSERGEGYIFLWGERYYIFLHALVRRNDWFACHLLKNSSLPLWHHSGKCSYVLAKWLISNDSTAVRYDYVNVM